ncbi:MAG: phage tail tape measure protein [Firmicutes bacterium]|nr:phage tail tape measure protein [Bacillota bacterium]
MSDAVLGASIRAFDEFSQQFHKLQQELRKTDQEQRKTAQGTEKMNRSVSDFFEILGGVGALYAFQQGLRAVAATGREFQLSIRQAQAVTGDFTSALRDFTMQVDGGIHGPLQMAEAFYELGSAGLNANDTIASTPGILDFATAGLINLEQSAYSVIATVQAFRLEWDQTTEVTDAFTEAMNSTTLAAKDFQWIMSSAGAVAKMAGQDFREVLAAGAAMKDAGVQAQDAGTSIKAALLQLINPTDEAKEILTELGVEVYNASGQMKQWHEIVAGFEQALAPYNQESRNMILATVLGSDGIRAMATSLNTGSAALAGYVDAMSSAEGATGRMADMMADTFDGALRKTSSNLERMQILIFEDVEPALVALLSAINDLIVGFNSLDDSTRQTIEVIAGSAGLVVALGTLFSVLRMLAPMLGALGVGTAALTGPIGLAVAAVGALTTGLITMRGASENARLEIEKQNEATVALGDKYEELTSKLNTMERGTEEHRRTKEQLTGAMIELGEIYPGIIEQYNAEGEVIAVNNELLREKIRLSRESAVVSASDDYSAAKRRLLDSESELNELDRRLAGLKSGEIAPTRRSLQDYRSTDAAVRQREIDELAAKRNKLQADVNRSRAELKKYEAELQGVVSNVFQDNWAKSWDVGSYTGPQGEDDGGKPYTPPGDKDGKKGKTAEQLAREEFEASRRYIEYRKALNQMALEEELAAWERVQSRYKQGSDERMEADMEVYRAKQEIAQRDKRLKDDAYNQAMDLMRHEVNMGRMSTEERIRYLEKLRDAHEWSTRQMWEIEERLYRLRREQEEELYRVRRQQLSEYMGELEEEYQEEMDDLDNRFNRKIRAIQNQIDALDEEGQESDREEAARQHNQRLQELEEKRRYHELRTGTEHQKAISDVEEQIAEERRQFELQQQEWEREDQKEHLEEKLEQIREKGERERDELEEHYRRARDIATDGIMDIVAALAATEPEWMDTGKQLIDALIDGMKSGDFSDVEDIVDRVRDEDDDRRRERERERERDPDIDNGDTDDESKEPTATISRSQYQSISGTAAMWSRTLANILDESVSFDSSTGRVKIGGKTFTPLKSEDGKTYVGIRSVAEALGHDVEFDSATKAIRIYHQGGPVPETGLAYLQQGEYVLPANLVDAIRMGAMPPTGGVGAVQAGGNQTIININAPLLSPEKLVLSDDMDIKGVGMGLRREIMAVATAKG